MRTFFTMKDLIFFAVCGVGMLVHAAINKSFSINDLWFMGVCSLLIVVYNIIRIIGGKINE
jgi:hypothetical protein